MNQTPDPSAPPPVVFDAFQSAALTVFQELAQFEPFPEFDTDAAVDAPGPWIAATLTLRREPAGRFTLLLHVDAATELARRFLPPNVAPEGDIVDDVVAEFANVIAGQAKTLLKGTPQHFLIVPPVVARAESLEAFHPRRAGTIVVAVNLDAFRAVLLVELPA